MRQHEINIFNQFLTEAGIRDEYLTQYNNNRIGEKGNLEKFLSETKASDVFVDGFSPVLANDPEWQTAMNLWKEYMGAYKAKWKFCPCCWQLKPVESFTPQPDKKDGLFDYCRECQSPTEWARKHPGEKPEGCMSAHECIVSNDKIYLNMELSQLLREKGFKHCGLRHQDGKLFFIFCEKDRDRNVKFYKTGGASVTGEELAGNVIKSLNIDFADPIHLRVTTNKAIKPTAVTIEVIQGVSHEVYAKNPFTKAKDSNSDTDKKNRVKENGSVKPASAADPMSCITGYKFCIGCCSPKPVGEFGNLSKSPDGLNRICRKCNAHPVHENCNTISENTAILFGSQIIFDSKISGIINENNFRCCRVRYDRNGSCSLEFGESCPGKTRNASMFTACSSSGVTSLKEEDVVDAVRNNWYLEKDYAYVLSLTSIAVLDGTMSVSVIGYTPYTFRKDIESRSEPKTKPVSISSPPPQTEDKVLIINKELHSRIKDIAKKSDKAENVVVKELIEKAIDIYYLRSSSSITEVVNLVFKWLVQEHTTKEAIAQFVEQYEDPGSAYMTKSLEKLFANSLKAVGWKLQRPVKVVKYEEF